MYDFDFVIQLHWQIIKKLIERKKSVYATPLVNNT